MFLIEKYNSDYFLEIEIVIQLESTYISDGLILCDNIDIIIITNWVFFDMNKSLELYN